MWRSIENIIYKTVLIFDVVLSLVRVQLDVSDEDEVDNQSTTDFSVLTTDKSLRGPRLTVLRTERDQRPLRENHFSWG